MLGMHAEVGDVPVPASDAVLGEPQVGCWVAELAKIFSGRHVCL